MNVVENQVSLNGAYTAKRNLDIKMRQRMTKDKIHKTGTPRPSVYCKICKKRYLDFCMVHHGEGTWELRND